MEKDMGREQISTGKRSRPTTLNRLYEEEQQEKSVPITLQKLMEPKTANFNNYDSAKEKDLPRSFFRQEVVELSKALLGKVLVHETDNGFMKAVIVETEAYKAPEDQACHAKNNTKTERTKYFWLDGGHLYIYTIYMPTNICLNVVAGLENEPEAVLIRAVQPVQGIQLIRENRQIKSTKAEDLCNGPGKVGQSLGVDKQTMNGIDLTYGCFRVIDAGLDQFKIGISKRINIDSSGEWANRPWRFFVKGNTYVSKVNFNKVPKKKR